MLSQHAQLIELLELPQLMDTCVKNRYYEEALQLRAHAVRLGKKYGDIPMMGVIVAEVEECTRYSVICKHLFEVLCAHVSFYAQCLVLCA